jgi:hypothetical protein
MWLRSAMGRAHLLVQWVLGYLSKGENCLDVIKLGHYFGHIARLKRLCIEGSIAGLLQ